MEARLQLKSYMENNKASLSYIADKLEIGKSSVSMFINGKYKGDLEKLNEKVLNFLQRELEREDASMPYVDITVAKYIFEIGRVCHTRGRIGVCVGLAGLGKTVAAKQYVIKYMDAILIESDFGYTAKSLLRELHHRLGLSDKGSTYDLMDEVVNKLNRSGRLLIIDEAENLAYRALETVRRIHDKTGIGVLLLGREILLQNLTGKNYQYDQMYSRVQYPKRLNAITLQDVKRLLEAVDQDTNLANTYLHYSKGNTRFLEHLISQSISIAKISGKTAVDDAVIREASKLLMGSAIA